MLNFYKNKNILVTGHTGFKGCWLCKILDCLGANVTGFSLEPATDPNLFSQCSFSDNFTSVTGDIRDFDALKKTIDFSKPEIVLHLAAQPLVFEGYQNPQYTYEVNVIGTVNLLECIRLTDSVKSFVNVTTDKVYKNNEWEWGYRENDVLDGFDPYSNSKSCSELVTDTYRRSFFNERNVSISTARAGNVIGGGDFSEARIIPDCIRAACSKKAIVLRSPYSIRPYQFVLEPLFAYLLIAQKQYENKELSGSYNIGPDEIDCITTLELVQIFRDCWGEPLKIEYLKNSSFYEAGFLKLDSSKLKSQLNWKPHYSISEAVSSTVEFAKSYIHGENINDVMEKQIEGYMAVKRV